jgi:hypothetical protein
LELSATIHLRGVPDLTGFSAHAGEVSLLSVGKGGRLTMSISISGLDPFASYYLRLYRDGAQPTRPQRSEQLSTVHGVPLRARLTAVRCRGFVGLFSATTYGERRHNVLWLWVQG